MTRWSRVWPDAAVLAPTLMVAVLVGMAMAFLPLQSSILLLSLGALALVLIASWPVLFWSFMFVLGCIVGPLQYLGGFTKAFWLPHLMGVLMAARIMSKQMAGSASRAPHPNLQRVFPVAVPPVGSGLPLPLGSLDRKISLGIGLALGMAAVFAITLLLSSLAHRAGVMQALIGGKEYLFLLSLPMAFGLGLLKTKQLWLLWPALSVWLSVQALMVLWQRFVIAPRRGGDAPWDAVVGLFAGKANGAGGSGTMAMVSLWAAFGVFTAWRSGLLRWPWALLASLSALLACALAEVKIAVVLLPLLALISVASNPPGEAALAPRPASRRRPWMQALFLACVVALSALLLLAHQQQFTASGSAASRSPLDYLETTIDRNLDARAWADSHGQLTRLGAIQYWWSRQSGSDIPGWLIGHGVGAVRRSALAPSDLLQGLRFEPGRSTAVILLWETGILGLAAWLLSSLAFLRVGTLLLKAEQDGREAVFLRAAVAAIAITLLSLPYGADWFEAPHLATMHLLGIGWICGACRRHRLPEAAPCPAPVGAHGPT